MADNTMVGVAVPAVRTRFALGVTSLQWVVAGYVVAFAALLFTGGALGDWWGRKRALVVGVALFSVGGVVAATAWSFHVLVAGRVVQGVGAACSEPGTLSLVRQLYPDEHRRARVLGGWAAASGVALAAGPVIAGLLVAVGGWRAVFWGEAGFGLVAGVVGATLLIESRDPSPGRDLRGQAAAAVALASTTFALIDGQDHGFASSRVLVAWLLAAVGLAVFVFVERGRSDGVLDLSAVRDPLVASGLLAAAASSFALFSVLLLVSLDLQVVSHYSALSTAGVFAPMTVAMVLAGLVGGRWAARAGPRSPLVAGLAIAAVSLGALDLALGRPLRILPVTLALAVTGAGLGLVVAPMAGAVLARIPARRSGMGAAVVTAGREVGGILGVAVLGAIVNATLVTNLTGRLARLKIPVGLRSIVVDAIERGTPPKSSGHGHGTSIVDRVIDAGKSSYVDSVRTALVVAVGVLAAGAVSVGWLSRHPQPFGHAGDDMPTSVGPRC
jgi:MFS family permease